MGASTSLTRRGFVAAAAPLIVPARVFGAQAPSKQLTLAFIGTGNNGVGMIEPFLEDRRVRVVAVCDVNREGPGYWDGSIRGREPARRLVDRHYGDKGCAVFTDFRELLARKDIDAVHIATPDHWHAITAIHAARAGKHIFCQKPLAVTVAEGRRMVEEVEKAKVVWQTGSQQRSDWAFLKAVDLLRSGRIGKIKMVRVGLPGGVPDFGKTASQTETVPVPDGFDYDFWLGPAPEAPYCPARVGVNFRWVRDYSGGQITDWGAHHIDCAQWGLGTQLSGPVSIRNAHGKFARHPIYNTAVDFYFECVYGDDTLMIVSSSERFGVRWVGEKGWVWASRGRLETSFSDQEEQPASAAIWKDSNVAHCRNFVDAILEKATPAAPIEVAHRSITIAHLANIALLTGRDLKWDPRLEQIVGDPKANAMLSRPYRKPWTL